MDRGDAIPKAKYTTFDLRVLEPGDDIVLHGGKACLRSARFCQLLAALQDIYQVARPWETKTI